MKLSCRLILSCFFTCFCMSSAVALDCSTYLKKWKMIPVECIKPYPPMQKKLRPGDILFENDKLIFVSKPTNQFTTLLNVDTNNSLLNAVVAYLKEKGESVDLISHLTRLDKDTTGVTLFVKNDDSIFNTVQRYIVERNFNVFYYALVPGNISRVTIVDYPIGKDSTNIKIKSAQKTYDWNTVGDPVKKVESALSVFMPLVNCHDATLVKVKIWTGRTHQIRVHAKSIGHPLIGDRAYGGNTQYLKRQFLHRGYFAIRDPETGHYLEIKSPLPADLIDALQEYCDVEQIKKIKALGIF